MEKKWYVLHTLVSREKQVKEAIEKLLPTSGLEDFFGEIIIPSHKTFMIKDGKRTVRESKVFPNYVLIEMVMRPDTYGFVIRIPGVMKFLGTEKTPQPLAPKEINRILGIKDGSETITKNMKFIVGARIKIIDGPFNDFEGSIQRILEDKEKLIVDVTVFGRVTPVEVSFDQIEMLD